MKKTTFYLTIDGVRLPTKRLEELTMAELQELFNSIPNLKLNYEEVEK